MRSLDEIMAVVGPDFDLVLAEGFKKSRAPKIEVHRKDLGDDLLCRPEELAAVITSTPLGTDIIQLPWGDAMTIADFIERNFLEAVS